MRAHEIITEALLPSQYRKYVKGWDKSKWADIFGDKYRIYLELDKDVTDTPQPNPQVVSALNKVGYNIADYSKGLAYKSSDPRKQLVRIGKVLSDTRLGIPPEIKTAFERDPTRSAVKADKLVVISRHPYDIAGMSTGRGWTSCMNLNKGLNRPYVMSDVEEGTIVAYLINRNDTNITNPMARVLIKPFINTDNPDEVALGVEDKVYGTASDDFASTVVKWADSINASRKLNGLFILASGLYQDGSDRLFVGDKLENYYIQEIKSRRLSLRNVPQRHLTEKICIAAVQKDGESLRDVPQRHLTEKVCIAAVQQKGSVLRLIPQEQRTEKICLAAVQQNGTALTYVPQEVPNYQKICIAAVQQDGRAIEYVPGELRSEDMNLIAVQQENTLRLIPEKQRTKKVCLIAVQNDVYAIDYVPEKYLTEKLCIAVVQQNGYMLRRMHKELRTAKVCLAAVQQNGRALGDVPKELLTERICLAAVQQNAWALEDVPKELRTEKVCLAAVQQNGFMIGYVPKELLTERICLAAVQQNGRVLQELPYGLRTEKVCLAAVQQNGSAFPYVLDELKQRVKDKLGL